MSGGAPRDAVIRLEGVSKRFRRYGMIPGSRYLKTALLAKLRGGPAWPEERRLTVLDGVDLEVDRGTTLAILGRNGSGKSTLLKLFAGIYRPDSGRVSTRGRVAALLELGTGFHPDFSGRENVLINGTILGLSGREIRERFDRIVAFSELEEFIEAPVRTYSSGMYVRLAFAVAIHVHPEILLVDEVLAVGDEGFRRKCLEKIRELRGQGTTIVFVSHELQLVEELATRAILVDHGKIWEGGTPHETIAHYRSAERMADAAFERVSLRAGPAEGSPALRPGAPFELRARLRARRAVERPAVGFEASAGDGALAFGLTTREAGVKLERWPAGEEREIVLRGHASLQPDVYAVRVVAGDEAEAQLRAVGETRLAVEGVRAGTGVAPIEAELAILPVDS